MTLIRRYSKAIAAALSALVSSGILVAVLGEDSPWVPVVVTLAAALGTVVAPKNTSRPPRVASPAQEGEMLRQVREARRRAGEP